VLPEKEKKKKKTSDSSSEDSEGSEGTNTTDSELEPPTRFPSQGSLNLLAGPHMW